MGLSTHQLHVCHMYVKMQPGYDDMELIYVDMQLIFIDIQQIYVDMQLIYIGIYIGMLFVFKEYSLIKKKIKLHANINKLQHK